MIRVRLGDDISIQGLAYGESLQIGNVTVSLHPADHVPKAIAASTYFGF